MGDVALSIWSNDECKMRAEQVCSACLITKSYDCDFGLTGNAETDGHILNRAAGTRREEHIEGHHEEITRCKPRLRLLRYKFQNENRRV